MKFPKSKFLMFSTLLLTIGLSSCEEGLTIDIPGPDINYQFSFSDIARNADQRSSNAGYQLVAQSDTIKGRDLESYLSASGKNYSSIVEAATISNAQLTLSDNVDFTGVDSLQIRYQIEGTNEEIVLAQASFVDSTGNTMKFSNLKISKEKAFELIKNNIVARIYAIYDVNSVNCFKTGVTYNFKANTTLSVKLSSLTEGLTGVSK